MKNMLGFVAGYVDYKGLDAFFTKESGAGGLKESFFLVLIGQCISFLTISLAFWLGYLTIPGWGALPLGQAVTSFFVMTIIVNTVVFYITAALIFACAKLLGGKGTLESQAYLMGTVTLSAGIISSPFIILFVLLSQGAAGMVLSLAVLALGIYQLYAVYKLVRAVHGLDMLRALGAMLATLVALWLAFSFFMGQMPPG